MRPSSTVPHLPSDWILNLGITSRCPQQCSHCAPMSGPTGRDHLPLDVLSPIIAEAAGLGCRLINLTGGGEPFVLGAGLAAYVRWAAENVGAVRASTSGYWAGSNRQRATCLVETLA